MTEKYIKIIERESNLEQFAEGDIVGVKVPETTFSFERGIQPNVKSFKYGRVYKKRNGMMFVYRDEYTNFKKLYSFTWKCTGYKLVYTALYL